MARGSGFCRRCGNFVCTCAQTKTPEQEFARMEVGELKPEWTKAQQLVKLDRDINELQGKLGTMEARIAEYRTKLDTMRQQKKQLLLEMAAEA